MGIDSKRILIGIFSYNEGENLSNMYYELKRQSKDLCYKIVLIDESDEIRSISIVNEIISSENTVNIRAGQKKRGKVHGYNLLYDYFLGSDYDILLHFDADHVLSGNNVQKLAESIDSNFNIATCLNKPLRCGNFFQRILYIMALPATYLRETGKYTFPLVGHNGAYDRNAVKAIGKIPSGGIDEESYVLAKIIENGLSSTVVQDAISYYALPGTLSDYMRSTRRVYSRVITFEKRYPDLSKVRGSHGHSSNINKTIYSRPQLRTIAKALFSDPIAASIVPYIFLIRFSVMRSAGIYTSDTWETISTTKKMKV